MILMRLNNDKNVDSGVRYVNSSSGGRPRRDHYLDIKNLEAGTYYMFLEMQWEKENYSKNTFVLSTYGP